MSKKQPSSLADILARPDSAVARLARAAAATEDLAATLRAALPADLASALSAATLREDGTLVILAASPAWATRLRFEGEALLARCRERHPGAERIRVRVAGAAGSDE
jgi:hypothetical protein